MITDNTYDVLVVGGGHAGVEAALAAARMNKKTALFSIQLDSIAALACNPSIGGTAKGHIVREVDALGGQMGLAADATFIQIKMLNVRKGPAVHSLRAQNDKYDYHYYMKHVLENQEGLDLIQDEVMEIITTDSRVAGVQTAMNVRYHAPVVILATGVYLKSKIIIGEWEKYIGPGGLQAATGLSGSLAKLGYDLRRFKTGTPARVDARSIDFDALAVQAGDEHIQPFSFMSDEIEREQIPCHLAYTNEHTHEIIRENLHRCPMYSGVIQGTGARYCPAIEDKIVRFPDKERHQLFLEPEGRNTHEIYVQGLSSSMPLDVQIEAYRTVEGMEQVHIMRPGYAIEYDCVDPTELYADLSAKKIPGLFMAGQINGTSGYEEAAGQGLLAGINAVRYIEGEEPLVLGRDQAYTGVLVDDLITKGTDEPYRMMTSRAEYRLLLRQDNADARLTEIGRRAGLVSDARYDRYMRKYERINKELQRMEETSVSGAEIDAFLESRGDRPRNQGMTLSDLLRRNISYDDMAALDTNRQPLPSDVTEQVETTIKYAGYIAKQQSQVQRMQALEQKQLPPDIDYGKIKGIRLEARDKLGQVRPQNLGQASRISGVSPADVSVLMVYLAAHEGNMAGKTEQ